jgi:hypothetical protein
VRDTRHQRQHHHRVEETDLPAEFEPRVEAALVDVVQPKSIGEEQPIEEAAFQDACDMFVPAGLQHVPQVRIRMSPRPHVVRGWAGFQVGEQMHLTLGHRRS